MRADAADPRRASIRLAVQFTALMLVLLALLIGVAFVVVGAGQAEATNRTLIDAVQHRDPEDAPAGVLVALQSAAGTMVTRDAPSWFPDRSAMQKVSESGGTIEENRSEAGHNYIVRTSTDRGRIVQAALDTRESSEELRRVGLALGLSGALAAAAAGFIAVLMGRRAMRPMVEALALQRRFVADASHELRTPLTLLSTRAQLVRRRLAEVRLAEDRLAEDRSDANADEIAHGIDEVVQDSRVLTEILEDLLIAADPRESVELTKLDLVALADDAINTLGPEAERRGIRLHRAEPGLSVVVDGARVSMLRLYTALITNAIDHALSEVTVEVRSRGRVAEIRVSDDGPGFSEESRGPAFERFATSRPASAAGEHPRHYGLGLALVAEVAARHRGGVTLEPPRPGIGAVIVVTLPLSR
jgi:two-component system OmpR family sensor kinase